MFVMFSDQNVAEIPKNLKLGLGPVLTDRNSSEVKRSQFLADLLECLAVGGVAAEPEAPPVFGPEDGPAAPEGLAAVGGRPLAPVVGRRQHEPRSSVWMLLLLF